jgi:cytochrome c peroxidase
MKNFKVMMFVVLVLSVSVALAFAMQHEASVEKGKVLFNDPKLGTTGKSCNDCHKDGKGLDNAWVKAGLERIINSCITNSIKGKALDPKSVEMQSMVLYIKSFGEKKPAAKKPAVGC